MEIILIAAVDLNMGIGYKGDQLAYISEDLKRFKEMTMGHAVVMGRKTFEAMGKKGLAGRCNIVITRHRHSMMFKPSCGGPETHVVSSPAEAIVAASNLGHEKIFIIGGGEIYNRFISLADRMEITIIAEAFEHVDTYMPTYTGFDEVGWSEEHTDTKTGLKYRYATLRRKEGA